MGAQSFDICIAGGGLVGLAQAIAFARMSLSVAVIEAKPVLTQATNPDESKALALTYATCTALKNLGVWPRFAKSATPINSLHVSEKGKFGRFTLAAAEVGLDYLGQLVPGAILEEALWQEAQQYSEIAFFRPAKISHIDQMSKTLGLSTEQGTTEIAYQLLIAADGVCSKTRELLGVDVDETDYQQSALVTRVELSQENHGVAYQRVTSLGTLALLPIDKKRCGVIISGAKEKIENWLALNDEQFLLQLQSCFGFKLGRLLAVTKRLNYPLKMVIAKQQVVNSAIVMGNAAHLIHPVAAQGFNLSMQDIAVLTELTQEAVKRGESIASPQLLADYLAWRQGAQDKTIHATDSLVSLFSSDSRLLKQARHLGLMGLEYAPILKPMFARFAMGLSGKQAKLIQN